MSLHPVRVPLDSVNGGTYDFRRKAAAIWRELLDNEAAIGFAHGSRYFQDFMSIADAPAAATYTGEMAVTDYSSTTPICIKNVPATTTRPLHGWVRSSTTTADDDSGMQVAFPRIGDMRFTTGKVTCFEWSGNLRKGSNWFIGGGETSADIMTDSDSMADKDFIGFRRQGGGVDFVTHKTGVTEQSVAILTEAQLDVMAAGLSATSITSGAELDLPINLAWRYNGNGTIEIAINGKAYPAAAKTINTAHAMTACFPTLSMTRTVCLGRNDTDDEATVAIEHDWIETFQQA